MLGFVEEIGYKRLEMKMIVMSVLKVVTTKSRFDLGLEIGKILATLLSICNIFLINNDL